MTAFHTNRVSGRRTASNCSTWIAYLGIFITLLAANPLLAQKISLANPERVSGFQIRTMAVNRTSSAQEKESAKKAYLLGHVLRFDGASPADVSRLIGIGTFPSKSTALGPDRKNVQQVPYFTALRLTQGGAVQQFYARLRADHTVADRQLVEQRFREWELKQQTADGSRNDPSGPPSSWTLVYGNTEIIAGTDSNSSQVVLSVYRLNVSDKSGDYYMVLTDPTVSPNFKDDGCNAIYLAPCGWYTRQREITMSTTPQAILYDHGPTSKITTTTAGWSIGGGLDGNITAGYSVSWNQDSVTTTDASSPTSGIAQWTEDFKSEDGTSKLPATSTSTFLSHQGAIFQLPRGTSSFELNTTVTTTIIHQPTFGSEEKNTLDFVFDGIISPPQFSVTPASLTIPPGSARAVQVVAQIGNGDLGLDWVVSTVLPSWLTIDKTAGSQTDVLTFRVEPGTTLGLSTTINFNTKQDHAAPSVIDGPLAVQVTVGQSDLNGVMLIGGSNVQGGNYTGRQTALVYDVDQNAFTGIVPMVQQRQYHSSVGLLDGSVLTAAGTTSTIGEYLATAELYTPSTGVFQLLSSNTNCPGQAGCMIAKGLQRTATRLADGRVLFAGGNLDDGSGGVNASNLAEVYDPATKTFHAVGSMSVARVAHSATLLPDGQVLIVGGVDSVSQGKMFDSAELYDPTTEKFTPAKGGNYPVAFHTATLTSAGVLIAGGISGPTSDGLPTANSQIFDTDAKEFRTGILMNQARTNHTATRLPDGTVLLAGGRQLNPGAFTSLANAEIFDPATRQFTLLSGRASCPGALGCMSTTRAFHTATRLIDGRVFLSGGLTDDQNNSLPTTDIYDPVAKGFTAGPSFEGRVTHTAAFLRAPSSITVQSDTNPAGIDKAVSLSAQVTVKHPEALTGTVSFYDSSALIGTSQITNGTANLQAKLGLGQHAITAQYAGNDYYAGSQSDSVAITVQRLATSLSVSSSANPAPYGTPVTLTAQLTASGAVTPTGTVTFYDGSTVIGSVPAAVGNLVMNANNLTAGVHQITVTYSGDGIYQSSSATVLQETINGVANTTTLQSSANPAAFGSTVTFTAKVSGSSSTAPSGRVVFADADSPLASVSVTNGQAVYTTSTLSQGAHTITASYSGDTIYATSKSAVLNQTIGTASTTSSLTAVKNPVTYGQDAIVLNVAVTAPGGSKPTGSVSILEGTTSLVSGPLDQNGQATLTVPTALTAGLHQLTASYAGTAAFGPSTSELLTLTVNHAPVTATLSVQPASVTYGQAVTLVANIKPTQTTKGAVPTGTVDFVDGTKTLGTAPLDGSGNATLKIPQLNGGSITLSANYAGDTNFSGAQATNVVVNVIPATVTINLTSSLNPANLNQPVTLTATVASTAGAPTGKVAFLSDGVQVGLVDLKSGVATYNFVGTTVKTYALTASYLGDGNFAPVTSAALNEVINAMTATLVVSSSLNPSTDKATVTFTAQLNASGTQEPTGYITFLDGTTAFGSAQIVSGQAVFSTSTLTVGTHSISAKWGGDTNYRPSTSTAISQVVNPATVATQTTLASSKNPSSVGDTVQLTAQVKPQATSASVPTGTVTFLNGTSTLGTAPLIGGTAVLPVSSLPAGTNQLTATYSGDTNFAKSAATAITQTVSATPVTSVALASQTNPSQVGATASFVAVVTAGNGTPTGNVNFFDGTAAIGSATLTNGIAIFTTATLSVGSHRITASYAGDGTYPPATSAAVTQAVNRATSKVVIKSSLNPSNLNDSVTFTATVTSTGGTPTGSVTFYDGTTSLSTVALNSGVAVFTTSALLGGSHNITASYSGDLNILAGTSAILTQVVIQKYYVDITITSDINPAKSGDTVTFTVTVKSRNGGPVPTGNITLSELGSTPGSVITLGNSDLSNGGAQFKLSTLAPGNHVISVTYVGDVAHYPATSDSYQQGIVAPVSLR